MMRSNATMRSLLTSINTVSSKTGDDDCTEQEDRMKPRQRPHKRSTRRRTREAIQSPRRSALMKKKNPWGDSLHGKKNRWLIQEPRIDTMTPVNGWGEWRPVNGWGEWRPHGRDTSHHYQWINQRVYYQAPPIPSSIEDPIGLDPMKKTGINPMKSEDNDTEEEPVTEYWRTNKNRTRRSNPYNRVYLSIRVFQAKPVPESFELLSLVVACLTTCLRRQKFSFCSLNNLTGPLTNNHRSPYKQ